MPNNYLFPKFFLGLGAWSLGLFIFFLLPGCKEPDVTAPAILPDSEKLGLFYTDTVSVVAYTLPDDSIRSDETSLNLLGIYHDPVFGTAEASVYTQLRFSAELNLEDTTAVVVDSVVLSLALSGSYGTPGPQSFKIYELSEKMYSDSPYYSTREFAYNPIEIGGISEVTPNLTDSVPVGVLMEPAQLRIPINKETGEQLLKNSNHISIENFTDVFKGILIQPEYGAPPAAGEGILLAVNLLNTYSKLTVYYRDTTDADTFKFDFKINDKCARLTRFEFDRSGTSVFSVDSVSGNPLIYVQSMAGAKAKLKFPFLENFVKKETIAVNKAEIIFNVEDNSTDQYAPHTNLFLTSIDSAGAAGFIVDQLEGPEHYGGTYNASAKQYVFNVTRHIQYLLTNYEAGRNFNYGMYLMAGGKAINANRTILKGNKNTNGGVKLRISYTPVK